MVVGQCQCAALIVFRFEIRAFDCDKLSSIRLNDTHRESERLRLFVYAVPGNHDIIPIQKDRAASTAILKAFADDSFVLLTVNAVVFRV